MQIIESIGGLRLASVVLGALILSGCGSSVRMEPVSIPQPLVDQIPMSVGLRMPENFEHFSHEEELVGGETWQIDLGRSNVDLFLQLFDHMFESVTVLQPEDDPAVMSLDALIEPSIDAFEFAVPNQTKTEAFAVWVRYRIKVYDPAGEQIADWPINAYGKSLTTTMGGSEALQRAAVLAMRDAAALMIIRFEEQALLTSLAGNSETELAPGNTTTAVQTSAVEGEDDE